MGARISSADALRDHTGATEMTPRETVIEMMVQDIIESRHPANRH